MADMKAEQHPPQATRFTLDFPVILSAVVTPEPGGGYSASVPDLPGCYTEGETIEEVSQNLSEVAIAWIGVHGEQLREMLAAPEGATVSPQRVEPEDGSVASSLC